MPALAGWDWPHSDSVESICLITAAFVPNLLVTLHPDKIWGASKLEALDLPRFCTRERTGTYLALSPAPNRFHRFYLRQFEKHLRHKRQEELSDLTCQTNKISHYSTNCLP